MEASHYTHKTGFVCVFVQSTVYMYPVWKYYALSQSFPNCGSINTYAEEVGVKKKIIFSFVNEQDKKKPQERCCIYSKIKIIYI